MVLVYLVVTLFLYVYQRNLLYHPVENNYFGDKLIVEIEKIQIITKDNIKPTMYTTSISSKIHSPTSNKS